MRYAFIVVLAAILILSGFERSQMNYEKPTPAHRWVFDYTGNEMAWWGVGGLILLLVDQVARHDDEFRLRKLKSFA